MTITPTSIDHRPIKGWRTDPRTNTAQLIHAVPPGRHTALCGVDVTVFGEQWRQPNALTTMSRCAVCTSAIDMMWA